MARLVYRDFDEFADALEGVSGRFIPTARSTADWWREGICPRRLSLRRMQIGGPATFAGEGEPGGYTFGLPITDPAAIRIDGHFLQADSFLFLHEDQPFTFTGQDVTRWIGITIPSDPGLVAPALLQGREAHASVRMRSALPSLHRLKWTVERAIASSVSVHTQAAAQAIDEDVSICLTHVLERGIRATDRAGARPQFSRARVIARTLALIEANAGQPLFIEDFCQATQVSERSLRNVYHDFFGVGPMRLIKLRQLREIRAALLRADPQRDHVTRIAARFGIWDFSLFARHYKALFGESPSRTLRTPPSDVKVRSPLSWLHYASRVFIDDTQTVIRVDGQDREDTNPSGLISYRVNAPSDA